MPYWMVSQHGTMPVYDQSELTRHLSLGWSLLNKGEEPDYSKTPGKATPAPVDRTAEIAAQIGDKPEAESGDILDGTVVSIVALFPAMTKAELEQMREREMAGKARKGLLKSLDEAIEEA